jgi:plastocyanin
LIDSIARAADREMNVRRRRLLLATGSAVALSAYALASRAAPATHTVTIDAFEFKPATLTVKRGDVVRWRNTDPVPHTATAKGRFDSGSIAAGATWQYTATAAGRIDYICAFHPTMKATLVVE